ncbi:unnamed protein product [Closterium sp. NIES-54]
MYALTNSAEGDCYLSVPPDPGIEAAALGASESAAPGTGEYAAPGAGDSTLSGTAPIEALHTFTLDSGASRSFFRDSTTLTPLSRPVVVSLADTSGGPVLAHSSTVLPCPAAPSGLLSGLHLPSFSTNLVSGADLQDAWVDQFTSGGQHVTHCTCCRTGHHLATFTRRPGSSLYTLTSVSPQVSTSGQVAASSQVFAAASRSSPASALCLCRPLSHETLLEHHRLGHPSLSQAPLQTLHMDVWGPARIRGQGHERYFLLVVDDYSRYTTVFPLRSKSEVPEGIRQTFTLLASPQQNGIAERRIGMVMDVARTSMIHAAAPHFLWLFAVQYAVHQIDLQPRSTLSPAVLVPRLRPDLDLRRRLLTDLRRWTGLRIWPPLRHQSRMSELGPAAHLHRSTAGQALVHVTQCTSGLLSGLHLPSFSTNLVSGADLQDAWVDQFTSGGQHVTHCTCSRTGRHLATFTRRPGSSLYALTTASPPVYASGQVAASSQLFAAASRSSPASAPCSCRPLSHETLLWHHRIGHPSLPRLRGMASRTLVSGLPRCLPPLPLGPAPTSVPCVEGRQRAAPHSSLFPPTEAPLQTLHIDVWGPARVRGQGHERYFLLVTDDYSRYTTVFPTRSKGDVTKVLIDWIRGARRQLSESFGSDLPVLRLHSDRGGEFSPDLLRAFYRAEGIRQTFTLPASPQQNGIAERRIGMVMDVACTSMIHAAAPHFLWPFAVQYAAHQINLQPRVSLPETTPTLSFTTPPRVVFCPLTPPRGPAPSGVSQVDPREPVEVAVDSGAARGAEPVGAGTGGAEPGGVEPGGAEPERVEPGGAVSGGAESGGSPGVLLRREALSPQRLREWYPRRCRRVACAAGAGGAGGAAGASAAGDAC